MLIVLPKAILPDDEKTIFHDGISLYAIEKRYNIESFFYSEPLINKNSELIQIGKILNVDVTIFCKKPKWLWPIEYNDLSSQYEKIEDKTVKEALALKIKMEKSKEKFIEKYLSTNEGWAEIQQMKGTLKELFEKIKNKPDYHLVIKYKYPPFKYFLLDGIETFNNPFAEEKESDQRLYKDILLLQEVLDQIEKVGYRYVTLFN